MVANAHRGGPFADWCANRNWGEFCCSALYLYFVLMERKKVLEAILTISAALLIIHFVLIYKYETHNEVLVPIALGLMLVALLSKWLSSKIIWLWFKLSEVMGYVMSRVVLSIVFFLFLFPISILYRLFNKDSLNLHNEEGSTYAIRNHTYNSGDLDNPW